MPQNPPVNPNKLLVVVTSLPDMAAAKELARALVDVRLAACVQLVDGMQSVYRWEGKVCEDYEVLLSAKTTENQWREISQYIQDHHPYDLPEILAFSPEQHAQQYGEWVQAEVNSKV
jgi:periplasmic divalent cation tolerance protein